MLGGGGGFGCCKLAESTGLQDCTVPTHPPASSSFPIDYLVVILRTPYSLYRTSCLPRLPQIERLPGAVDPSVLGVAAACIEPTHVFGLLFLFFPASYNIFLPVLLERNAQYLIYPEPGT